MNAIGRVRSSERQQFLSVLGVFWKCHPLSAQDEGQPWTVGFRCVRTKAVAMLPENQWQRGKHEVQANHSLETAFVMILCTKHLIHKYFKTSAVGALHPEGNVGANKTTKKAMMTQDSPCFDLCSSGLPARKKKSCVFCFSSPRDQKVCPTIDHLLWFAAVAFTHPPSLPGGPRVHSGQQDGQAGCVRGGVRGLSSSQQT